DELVDVERDAQAIARGAEIADHHAKRTDLPFDVHVPGLQTARLDVRVDGVRRQTRRGCRRQRAVQPDVAGHVEGRRQRWIRRRPGDPAGVPLVDHHRVRAADREAAVTGGIPDDADARLKIAVVLVDLVDARTDPDERIGCRVEPDQAVVGLSRYTKEVVAQAEL